MAQGRGVDRRVLAWPALAAKWRLGPDLPWWMAVAGEENRIFSAGGAVSFVGYALKLRSETALGLTYLVNDPSLSGTGPSREFADPVSAKNTSSTWLDRPERAAARDFELVVVA